MKRSKFFTFCFSAVQETSRLGIAALLAGLDNRFRSAWADGHGLFQHGFGDHVLADGGVIGGDEESNS